MKPPKPRYRTTNWSEYNRSLQARGDLTIWFSPEVDWHTNERRGWCKVHLAIDQDTLEIHAVEVTDQRQADGPQVGELLSQLPPETMLASLGGDGAYGSRRVYRVVHERGAELLVPPRRDGKSWKDKAAWVNQPQRKAGGDRSFWAGNLEALKWLSST